MIELPKRSVTRFFIPLIDVLVVLFGIFLLMPAMTQEGADLPDDVTDPALTGAPAPLPSADPNDPEALARLLHLARLDIARLKREKRESMERLSVQVLDIDGATGELFFGTGTARRKIASESDARGLVTILRRQPENDGRDLYFLFLMPRVPSGYPTRAQVETYRRWFAGIPSGFDNPNPR